MTPHSPYADLITQRRPLSRRNSHFWPNLKFSSVWDKRGILLSIYQMVLPRGSVNPMAPHSHYADMLFQRRPLQSKHTFSTKLEVHFYTGYTRQFIACISNGPCRVLWIQWHHPPLMRTWWPREDLSRRNTHFRANLNFTSIPDKRGNLLPIYQIVPLRGSVNPMTPQSSYADLMT